MKKKLQQLINWFKRIFKAITPGKNAMKGASAGLLILTSILWVVFSLILSINLGDGWVLLVTLLLAGAAILFGFLSRWLFSQFNKLPKLFRFSLFASIPLLMIASTEGLIMLMLVILGSICGATIWVLKKSGFKALSITKKIVTALGIIIGFGGFLMLGYFYHQDGFELDKNNHAAFMDESAVDPIDASSPAEKGSYSVLTMTYGSGKDRHRPEYGEEVDIATDSVNGVAFIDHWEGFGGWWRKKYWGFDEWSLPINGRVWYPDGEGPFPLVLIVHGNHGMQDYSDPGYDYLGELLASRGMILASVDENFINGSWSDIFTGGLENENDARGWLLLEHLKVWHKWNKTTNHLFHNAVDTARIALIGHSRGGEAVAHAAMFNKLPYYPDDASVKFDYNFDIKSIVAIAPVDGQYRPGDSKTQIEDVNYFVFHGSQDADVSSFMGAQQFERVVFKDSLYHFKSSLYIFGANHGQFNTSWGNNDTGMPFTGKLNLKQLLPAKDQEVVAKAYISAFLEATLKDKKEYIPLFMDARKGKEWLPETIYLSEFEDSNFKLIAGFDEDFNLSSVTQGGSIDANNLKVWREQEIKLKWQQKGSRALVLGWDYELEDEKDSIASVPDSLIASYTIDISTATLDSSTALVFSMAESTESSNPKTKGKWVKNNDDSEEEEEEESDEEERDEEKEDDDQEDEPEDPIDFSIQLTNSSGTSLNFPLSTFSGLQREIEVVIMKTDFITDDKQSEQVFQTFYFPLADLQAMNPTFDLSSVNKITFVFDRTDKGVVIIDDIGMMKSLTIRK